MSSRSLACMPVALNHLFLMQPPLLHWFCQRFLRQQSSTSECDWPDTRSSSVDGYCFLRMTSTSAHLWLAQEQPENCRPKIASSVSFVTSSLSYSLCSARKRHTLTPGEPCCSAPGNCKLVQVHEPTTHIWFGYWTNIYAGRVMEIYPIVNHRRSRFTSRTSFSPPAVVSTVYCCLY